MIRSKTTLLLVATLIILAWPAYAQQADFGISLQSPGNGYSGQDIFDIIIKTNASAELCKYSNNPSVPFDDIQVPDNFFTASPDRLTHTIKGYSGLAGMYNVEKQIHIKCRNPAGLINEDNPVMVRLRVDNTPPVFTYTSPDPQKVIERLEVKLNAFTDDIALCRFDDRETRYDAMRYPFSSQYRSDNSIVLKDTTVPGIADKRNYSFFISCKNPTGQETQSVSVSFGVDLSQTNSIIGSYPQEGLFRSNASISVLTNRNARCSGGGSDNIPYFSSQSSRKNNTFFISQINEGEYTALVTCVFDVGTPASLSTEVSFTVDKTPPSNTTVVTDTVICEGDDLEAEFSATDNIKIRHYIYSIKEGDSIVVKDRVSDDDAKEKGIDLVTSKTYKWIVKAVDTAGNQGKEVESSAIAVKADNSTECLMKDRTTQLSVINSTQAGGNVLVTFSCVEPDSSRCKAMSYAQAYPDDPACRSCQACRYTTYTAPVLFTRSGTFCYNATDKAGKQYSFSKPISVGVPCTKAPGDCCLAMPDGTCDTDCQAGMDKDCKTAVEPNITKPQNLDNDTDIMPNDWEIKFGLDPLNSSDASLDKDNDNLTNAEEYRVKDRHRNWTDPTDPDTDNDGAGDGTEITAGTNPLDPKSKPATTLPSKPGVTKNQTPPARNPPATRDDDQDEDEEADHTFQFILIFLGVISIGGGLAMLVSGGKPKSSGPSYPSAGDMHVSFQQVQPALRPAPLKQEMPSTIQDSRLAQPASASPQEPKKVVPLSPQAIQTKIVEKRKLVKRKRRAEVFDEFAKETVYVKDSDMPKPAPKMEQKEPDDRIVLTPPQSVRPRQARADAFSSLNDIVAGTTFRKLSSISKRGNAQELDRIAKKSDESSSKVEEKLDSIIKRGKR